MKPFLYILACLCSMNNVFAQKTAGSLVYFDKKWEETDSEKKAKYLLHKYRMDDTTWVFDFYNFKGPKIRQESYRDAAGKNPNGFHAYYSADGLLDSCGNIFGKLKSGGWLYFKGEKWQDLNYKKFEKGLEIIEQSKPKPSIEMTHIELESSFPGGDKGWQQFLNKNLRYPDRAIDFRVSGNVTVMFIVDEKGKIAEPLLSKSVEYSLDEESLRMINISPDWVPAIMDGNKVKSYKKQPITFRIERG